jgi:hypothetical protein
MTRTFLRHRTLTAMASSMISVNVVRGANEKKDHHLKPGTGPQKASRFQNPWPSYVDVA